MLVFVSAGLFDAMGQVGANPEEIPIRPLDLTGREHSSDLRPLPRTGRPRFLAMAPYPSFSRARTGPSSFRVIPPDFYVGISTNLRSEEFLTFGHFESRDGIIMGERVGKMIAATPRFGD